MTEELTLIRVKRKVTDDPEKGIQFSAKKVPFLSTKKKII